jgi:hypothetical protein
MDNKNIKYILFMYIQNDTLVLSGTETLRFKQKTEMASRIELTTCSGSRARVGSS